jgi:hypothetical protein
VTTVLPQQVFYLSFHVAYDAQALLFVELSGHRALLYEEPYLDE